MMKKRTLIFAIGVMAGALGGFAQSDTTFRFQPIAPKSIASKIIPSPQVSIITPNIVAPKLNNYTPPEPLKLDYKFSQLSDSLKSTPELSVKPQVYRAANEFDFRGNPFSRNLERRRRGAEARPEFEFDWQRQLHRLSCVGQHRHR